MSLLSRASVATAFGVGCVMLAACGDNGEEARRPLTPVQPTSYVTIEPETTTTTIAPSATTVPPGGAIDPNEQVYVIQGGDSVSKIAGNFGITMDQLVQYNQWPDGINHVLIPGNEIKIPPNARVPGSGGGATGTPATPGGTTAPNSGQVPPATQPASEGCTHTIVAGENPSRVANKYDISVQVLQQANPEHDFTRWFMVGGEIRIPAGADCP